jgi:serine protease Do
MIHKLTIATTLLALFVPAVASGPEQPSTQINTYPEGFFYSAGRSYLGVDVRDITSDRVSALKLKEERGVEIVTVDQDAPAGKAGIKEHDVILEYNGTRVESEEQLRRMIRETPPGRNVTLGISRDGNPMTLTAQIGDRAKLSKKNFTIERNGPTIVVPQPPEAPDFNMPFDVQVFTYTPSLGIQVDNLNQQLGEYFGVKNGEGLLVKSVEKGSPAEKAGMRAGDVITRADKERVSDRADLRRILRAHRSGGKLNVGIIRDKREQNLVIDLPARKSDDSSGMELFGPGTEAMEDLESRLEDLQPEINGLVQNNLQQLRPELEKAQDALRRITPGFQKSMRDLEPQMRHLQKKLQNMQKEWHLEFNDFI